MIERVAVTPGGGAITDSDRLAAVRATGLLDTPAESAFDELAALGAALTSLPLAFITFVDEQRSYWKAAIGAGIDGQDTTTRQNSVEQSFCQYVIDAAAPVIINDAATDPRSRNNPSVRTMGVRAWAGFPVRDPAGHVLGSFCVVDTAPREFSTHDLQVLAALADAASREVALRHATRVARDLAVQVAGANERLLQQVAASDVLGSTLDPAHILAALTSLIVPQYGAWAAVGVPGINAVLEFELENIDEVDAVAVVHARGGGPDAARLEAVLRGFPFSTDDSNGPGRVLATGTACYEAELGDLEWMSFPRADARQLQAMREVVCPGGSAATFPLSSAGRTLAAVTVGAPSGGDLDRELLADLARRAGTALDNALVYRGERRGRVVARSRARHHSLLARAAQALHRRLDPATELRELARVTVPELADMSTVHLLDHPVPPGVMPALPMSTERVAFEAIAAMCPPDGDTNLVWTAPGDPIPAAIAEGKLLRRPILTPQVPDWAVQTGSADIFRSGLSQVVLAPVIVDGLVVAVVSFGMSRRREPWTEEELDTLQEITRYASIALANGISFQRTRDSALVLQRSMLSDPPPVAGLQIGARYRPAGHDEVGGDWYDVFALGEDEIGIVVGDVVGHDITAAAAMGQLRAAVRTLATDAAAAVTAEPDRDDRAGPAALIDRLCALNRRLELTQLVSLIYGRMRRGVGGWDLRWCNAGHPPPALVGPDGATRILAHEPQAALHCWPGGPRHEHTVFVPDGSTLLFYTDGLIERRGSHLDVGTAHMLARAAAGARLSVPDLCDHLLQDAPTTDDIALLAVRAVPGS
jgi:GAF domain-containing protein